MMRTRLAAGGLLTAVALALAEFMLAGGDDAVVRAGEDVRASLPLVVVDAPDGIPQEGREGARMRIVDSGGVNTVEAPANGYDGQVGIRVRGQSSRSFPKLSYAVETRDDEGENRDIGLLGMPSDNDWVLYAGYNDKTLMRNVVGYATAARLGDWAPRTRFVELILRELRDTARGISDTDLSRRIEVKGYDEVAELGRTFNDMIDRLEGAFASQRAFVSDAGHELRTPITIIRGHLELLGDDPRERAETIEVVTDELDRMSRFVDDLLTLAKAERTDFLRPGPVDLDELTDELLTKATGLARREWRLEANAAGRITADRQRVTQAVMNLAHNAVQHTGDGDAVALGSALGDGEARLWVRDSGPGVAADQQTRIFERFARSGTSVGRSEGPGWGWPSCGRSPRPTGGAWSSRAVRARALCSPWCCPSIRRSRRPASKRS